MTTIDATIDPPDLDAAASLAATAAGSVRASTPWAACSAARRMPSVSAWAWPAPLPA